MRYPQGDLAILSAETYDPGNRLTTAGRNGAKKKSTAPKETGKKRKLTSPDDSTEQNDEEEEEEEEEKKRTRGRPRLDTKDETAAERRRTQIRLAQRAYRNRKENAIQTLEKKVQELKETNEEMSNAFMKLQDFAIAHGLLEQVPEFARQLRGTTEIFLALARRSNDDNEKEDENIEPSGNASPLERQNASQIEAALSKQMADITASVTRKVTPTENHLLGGLMVSHEPTPENKPMSADYSLDFDASEIGTNLDYEIVTYPTIENASFPFSTDFNFGTTDNKLPSPVPSPLFPSLPPPRSYAGHETTFGRRLQRTALERALALISMPDPPSGRFAKIFGFCLLFEPIESIKARLQAGVERSRQESLYNWEYPFLQLGGAGTHFDSTQYTGEPIGNQGTIDIRKPKSNTGFGIGPYNGKIVAAGTLLDKDLRMGLSGFRADFYDCDEVEVYLRQRGVAIPGTADFVTVEVDMDDFEEIEDPLAMNSMAAANELFGPSKAEADFTEFNGIDVVRDFAAAINAAQTTSRSPSASSGDASTTITVPSPEPEASKTWAPAEPLLSNNYTAVSNSMFMDGLTVSTEFGNGNLLAFAGISVPDRESRSKRRVVTVDVNVLISEMTERAACLGRSPGLRKADINAAFAMAIRTL